MGGRHARRGSACLALVLALFLAAAALPAPAEGAEQGEIRIGFLAPLTGGLAQSGIDSLNGNNLFWEQHGYEVAGRPVRVIVADTACDPDNAITQARRLIFQENVHFIIGPLCGHEGPPSPR